jgi:hypothetical protein
MTQKESELCILKENIYCDGLQWFEATISDNCKCFKTHVVSYMHHEHVIYLIYPNARW